MVDHGGFAFALPSAAAPVHHPAMRLRTWVAVGVVVLGGCVPPRYTMTEMSAPILVGDTLVMSAVTREMGIDDRRWLVRCPAHTLASNHADCEWYPMDSSAPRSEAERQRAAVAARAAVDHGCAPASVTVQSGSPAEGFWIAGCGAQWFYRSVEGTWVDQTPAR